MVVVKILEFGWVMIRTQILGLVPVGNLRRTPIIAARGALNRVKMSKSNQRRLRRRNRKRRNRKFVRFQNVEKQTKPKE